MRLTFTLALMLTAAAAGAQTTFYVSTSGNDAAGGTSQATAWRSIARANAATFVAGDRLLFEGGKAFAGTLRFGPSNLHSNQANPLTISSYGIGRATIDALDNDAIDVTDAAGMRITNLRVIGSSFEHKMLNKSGIAFTNAGTKLGVVTIDHVEVTGFSLAGVLLQSSGRFNGYGGVRIDNVSSHDNGYVGIALYGDTAGTFEDVTVTHNEVSIIPGYLSPFGQIVEGAGYGIVINGVLTATVRANIVHDNGAQGGGPFGISVVNANDLRVQENEVYSIRSETSQPGGGIEVNGVTSATVEDNYTHGNGGPGIAVNGIAAPVTQTIVRYNVSENDGGSHLGGFRVDGQQTIDSTDFAFNTIFSDAGTAVRVATGRVRFVDNIFMTRSGIALDVSSPTATFLGNDYFDRIGPLRILWLGVEYNSLASWRGATMQETLDGSPVGFGADPVLQSPGNGGTMFPLGLADLSAYRLQLASPLIDRALDPLPLAVAQGNRDFWGQGVHAGFGSDVGAYELHREANPPSLAAVANQTVEVGTPLDVDIYVSDPDGPSVVTLSLVSPPAFARLMRISATHAIVALAPATSSAPVTITVHAVDDAGLTSDVSFNVTVTGGAPPPPPAPARRRASGKR